MFEGELGLKSIFELNKELQALENEPELFVTDLSSIVNKKDSILASTD